MPPICKPTSITESTATIIDNILTNSENIIKSSILVTDISDHFPTTLSTYIECATTSVNSKRVMYRRNHSDDTISKLNKKLLEVNWCEILDGNNANDD